MHYWELYTKTVYVCTDNDAKPLFFFYWWSSISYILIKLLLTGICLFQQAGIDNKKQVLLTLKFPPPQKKSNTVNKYRNPRAKQGTNRDNTRTQSANAGTMPGENRTRKQTEWQWKRERQTSIAYTREERLIRGRWNQYGNQIKGEKTHKDRKWKVKHDTSTR